MTDNNNSLYTPFEYGQPESNTGLFTEESWMNFLDFTNNNRNNMPPADDFEEIVFNKPQEPNFGMEMEVEDMPFDRESYYKSFADDIDQDNFDFMSSRENRIKIEDNVEDSLFFDLKQEENPEQQVEQIQIAPIAREEPLVERSECSQCHSDEEEIDTSSVSTQHSYFNYTSTNAENDASSTTNIEENIFADQPEDFENDIKEKVLSFLSTRTEEERHYVEKITPMLINSIREVNKNNSMSMTTEVVGNILKDLLYRKEAMLSEERKHLDGMVEEDMKVVRGSRMDVKVKEEDVISTYKRKVVPGVKGKKNRSNLNHINENYVSNIFQFAKRSYLDDKEVQRIANERNVSALNFRKLMAMKLNDDVMTRKAKVRIMGAGRELLSNVEAYMTEGYFEQCADREKYIWHKEKALRDLALTGLN